MSIAMVGHAGAEAATDDLARPSREVEHRPGGPRFAAVWEAFYQEPGHEPELDDPLIKAGGAMVLVVCEAIAHADMKRRRYAIAALGYIGDSRAVPALEMILRDPTEIDYFRGDALRAIYLIDEGLGSTYAKEFVNEGGSLSKIVEAIRQKDSWLREPTEE